MKTVKWYHFILAALILIFSPALVGTLIGVAWSLMNLLIPTAYQSTPEWISLVCGVGACAVSVTFASTILEDKKPIFILVFCFIFAILWLLSLALDILNQRLWPAILDFSKLAVYLYFIIYYFKNKTIKTID